MTGISSLLWRLRSTVLSDTLFSERSSTVSPRAIHFENESLRRACLLSLLGVKVLKHFLHLYLLDPEEFLAQMIVSEDSQKGHLNEYFLLHCVILHD